MRLTTLRIILDGTDNNETCINGMNKIAERIKIVAKKVVLLELPNLKIGADFSA